MDQKTLSTLFSTEPLSEEQQDALTEIRALLRHSAEVLNRLLPETGEKQMALQNLYGSLTSAEQAIRLHGVSTTLNLIVSKQ